MVAESAPAILRDAAERRRGHVQATPTLVPGSASDGKEAHTAMVSKWQHRLVMITHFAV